MNMKKSLLILSSVLILGGLLSFGLNKQEVKEAKAIDYETYSGLYERIEDPSLVTPGTQVVLATLGGYVFEGIGGNPGYAHASPSNATMFENNDLSGDYFQDKTKFLYLKNKVVAVLDVYAGYQEGTVAFKSNFIVDGSYQYNHYLAANSENYNYGGMKDYDSMAWFLDSFGMSKNLNANSSWRLQYDSENKKMLIRNCSSNDETTYIRYNYNGARHHFVFDTAYYSNVNLYRPVDPSKIERQISTETTRTPTTTTYRKGDLVSFDGLVVTFGIRRDEETLDLYNLAYKDYTTGLFSSPVTIYSDSTQYIEVRIFEAVHTLLYIYQVTIINEASRNVFNKIDTIPSDLRGTYLLANSQARVFDPSRSDGSISNYFNNFNEDEINDFNNNGVITINEEELDSCVIRIVRTKIDDSYYYHALDVNSRYLCLGSQVDTLDEYHLSQTDTASVSNAITLEKIGSYIFLKMGEYYYCNSSKNRLISFNKAPNYDSGLLFKLSTSTTSVTNQVNSFITYFENQTKVCEEETYSTLPKISDELWDTIKTEFNNLGVDAQGIFASTTYVHGESTLATKENVADRYDYIVSKYSKEDFMLRKNANTYVSSFSSNSSMPSSLSEIDNSSVAIIIIAVAIGVSSLTLLLFIRKKKRYDY